MGLLSTKILNLSGNLREINQKEVPQFDQTSIFVLEKEVEVRGVKYKPALAIMFNEDMLKTLSLALSSGDSTSSDKKIILRQISKLTTKVTIK